MSSPMPFSTGWTAAKNMSAPAVTKPKISQNNQVVQIIHIKDILPCAFDLITPRTYVLM
jgi:hypothetical protein